ncbi:MAG: hypothetical protein ACRYFU_08625 [Janthinobacterium lividum]
MFCCFCSKWATGALFFGSVLGHVAAQTTLPVPATPPVTDPGSPASSVPKGQVLIQSHGEPPAVAGTSSTGNAAPETAAEQPVVDANAKADVTDEQRAALLITAYDLDTRLNPQRSAMSVRAQIMVRNDGPEALKQLTLQLSSTLHWESATLVNGKARTRLSLSQHLLETDADHTGAENEAILPLPVPLAPGASVTLDLFYSGTLAQSGGRLERLGANASQQRTTDWDAVSSSWTGVRGFGNVLWYPVATPQLFFAEGNSLFEAIGRTRLREKAAAVHLRLSVDYAGNPPPAAYFCGRRQVLAGNPDDPTTPTASGSGVAIADFPTEALGFRTLNLFVLQQGEAFPATDAGAPEAPIDDPPSSSSSSSSSAAVPSPTESASSSSSSSSSDVAEAAAPVTDKPSASPEPVTKPIATASVMPAEPSFLALESMDPGTEQGLAAAANRVVPLLREWLGTRPLSALTVIDHRGQPFQDGPLLIAPVAVLQSSTEAASLVDSLTRAWVQTGQPWMDEGLGEFFSLLWTEREQGRGAALVALHDLVQPIALAEPETVTGPDAAIGQPIITASSELFYRRKAAAVWWMLRSLTGDGSLHAALSAWRTQPASPEPPATQAIAFEHLLEKLSGKDLGWFFSDWVLRDRGLPDLSITDVATAAEPAGPGHPSGWLVAVTVRNEGGAAAEVPVIVISGSQKVEQRMRIPGFSKVTQRVLVQTSPTAIAVNDGSTPEIGETVHTRQIQLQTR